MIQIKKAESNNLKDIFELIKNDLYLHWTIESLKNELNNNYCLAGLLDNILVGFLSATIIDNIEAQITAIYIKKDFRRNKIGTLLLNKLLKDSHNKQINSIVLEVGEKNKSAINFYIKNGFNVTSKRNKYYPNEENALILTKSI